MAARPRVFLDINGDFELAGRLVIELFVNQTPRTCENFRQLCTADRDGVSYLKTPFHSIVKEFMVQGGDVTNGDGTGSTSIYNGDDFDDENLEWRDMDAAGLVCSANRGKNRNGSQFFITLEPCPHLYGKHTIFGRVVAGEEVLARIARIPVDENDHPLQPVLVSRCGELERRKRAKENYLTKGDETSLRLDERGRRRTSDEDESDHEMRTGDSHSRGKRKRRQSDNIVDEGIRGRPRLRSVSRSSPHPFAEDEGDFRDHTPERVHKRKRSGSPSRRTDRRSCSLNYDRRRRSLPSQYEHRHQDNYKDIVHGPNSRTDKYRYSRHTRGSDRYRPSKIRDLDSGRISNNGNLSGENPGHSQPPWVRFKGRGVMKYQEPDRARR